MYRRNIIFLLGIILCNVHVYAVKNQYSKIIEGTFAGKMGILDDGHTLDRDEVREILQDSTKAALPSTQALCVMLKEKLSLEEGTTTAQLSKEIKSHYRADSTFYIFKLRECNFPPFNGTNPYMIVQRRWVTSCPQEEFKESEETVSNPPVEEDLIPSCFPELENL